MNDVTRKLASIRRIKEIRPIEGADNIVCAVVDGWELVTQKSSNLKPGDLVVYFEIDSFLPETEKFEFLRKSSYKVMDGVGGFRLRTIKLRKQISQGLILPLSEFFTFDEETGNIDAIYINGEVILPEEETDLTEYLGIKKWEAPIHPSLAGTVKGNFPSFCPKTDAERIQNIIGKFQYLPEEYTYETTVKLDGSSMTVYYKDGNTGVCSRNMELIESEGNAYWIGTNKTKLIPALEQYGKNIAIQGELMGPGIQGNRENLKELIFFIFDIYDIDRQEYYDFLGKHAVINTLEMFRAKLNYVPMIDSAVKLSDFASIDNYLKYADRKSLNHPIAEGVVFKELNGKHSFKVINNLFLLKSKD
jgi:RNA ligase (TIGR02306 family)